MSLILRIFSAFIFILVFSISGASAQKVDPALFGALPAISHVEISPNGETVALLQNSGGQSTVVFFDLKDPGATPTGVIVGDVKARRLEWVDDNYILLLASVAQNASFSSGLNTYELARWISISKDERDLKMLFKQDAGFYVTSAGSILATTPNSPGDAIIARWTPDARAAKVSTGRLGGDIGSGYSLFNVNMKTGRDKITYRGNKDTWDWIIDDKGDAILRIDYDERRGESVIYRRRQNSKTFEHLTNIEAEYGSSKTISFYGLGASTNEILATTYGGENTVGLVGFDITTGEISRTVFRHDKYDVNSVYYDLKKATAVRLTYIDDVPRVVHLNPDHQKLQDNLAAALPSAIPLLASMSTDETKIIVYAVYIDRPTDIYLFDKASRQLSYFSSTRPVLADKIYAEKSTFNYISPDGLHIDGYITTPAGSDKRNMPLIVLPHGGPEGRDDQSFDWWAFFYAARGYAVYQPNFRGSYGYGLEFREAGYGEWGRKMQDDITNGVNKLVEGGIVDPARICIVGGSYGGYAALAGATLTPDVYACAVSVYGVSDLTAIIGSAAQKSSLGADYWETRIGSRFRDAAELRSVSPSNNAANARAPIMLIHGKDDTVVAFKQSVTMSEALTAAGKPHEFIELEGEDHWLSSGDTRTEMLRRSIDFIDQHIGQ